MTEEFEMYMKRFTDQSEWYETHANRNRWGYYGTSFTALVLSGALPVTIAVLGDTPSVTSIVALLSLGLLISEGSAALFRFNENWINYRITYEKLKREQAYFDGRVGAYTDPESEDAAERLFIMRVERLLREENLSWSQYAEDPAEDVDTGTLLKRSATHTSHDEP